MKSISNSDPIYSSIACQSPIPRFLLISLKYLGLSTFLKAPDLIRPGHLSLLIFFGRTVKLQVYLRDTQKHMGLLPPHYMAGGGER